MAIKVHLVVGRKADGSIAVLKHGSDVQAVKNEFKRLRNAGGEGYEEVSYGELLTHLRSKHFAEIKPATAVKARK